MKTAMQDEQLVKASNCQKCGGWVRVAALEYFKTNTKARNEFLKEVAKHNLSVNELPYDEWLNQKKIRCNCS